MRRGMSGWTLRRLLAEDEAAATRIGGAVENSVFRQDHDRRRTVAPVAGELHFVSHRFQLLGGVDRDAAFERDAAGNELMKAEGCEKVFGLEARRLRGLLRSHVEVEDVQQRLQQRL